MATSVTITGITPAASVVGVGTGFVSALADMTNMSIIVDGTITLSGSYTAGGDPLSFVSSTAGLPFAIGNLAPSNVEIWEQGVLGTATPGYTYNYVWGPTLANPTPQGGGLQIFGAGASSGAGSTPVSGAYSSMSPSLNGTVLRFRAWFSRGI
jgi:hypothetical protein